MLNFSMNPGEEKFTLQTNPLQVKDWDHNESLMTLTVHMSSGSGVGECVRFQVSGFPPPADQEKEK
jgi:hypothetical protein